MAQGKPVEREQFIFALAARFKRISLRTPRFFGLDVRRNVGEEWQSDLVPAVPVRQRTTDHVAVLRVMEELCPPLDRSALRSGREWRPLNGLSFSRAGAAGLHTVGRSDGRRAAAQRPHQFFYLQLLCFTGSHDDGHWSTPSRIATLICGVQPDGRYTPASGRTFRCEPTHTLNPSVYHADGPRIQCFGEREAIGKRLLSVEGFAGVDILLP